MPTQKKLVAKSAKRKARWTRVILEPPGKSSIPMSEIKRAVKKVKKEMGITTE